MLKPVKNEYDIIVVGAGPAGTIAAKTASEKGLSVLLLEKDREIGIPVRCGEMVGHKGISMAINPLKSWITLSTDYITFVSPKGIRVDIPCPVPSYMLDRPKMEKDIANSAAKKGAHILVKATAVDLLFDKNSDTIKGVKFYHRGNYFDVYSKIVIATDGIESRIAKIAGLNSAIKNLKDIGICAQYLAANVDKKIKIPQLHFGKNIVPDYYAWMFPKGDGTANIGLGISAHLAKKENPVDLLNKFIKLRFKNVMPLNLTVGSVPLGLYLKKLVKNGFMVAGDAARMANCIDGGGITYSMIAAKMAAKTACLAIQNNDLSEKFLSSYQKEWDQSLGIQQKRSYKLKNAVLKVKDRTIDAAATKLNEMGFDNISYLDIIKLTVKNQPSLILEAAKFFK